MSMAIGTCGLRHPLRDVQQDPPRGHCEKCRGEIYEGETVYVWDGKRICPDCLENEVMRWLRVDPKGLAYALGADVEEIE